MLPTAGQRSSAGLAPESPILSATSSRKRCPGCGRVLPLAEFYKNRSRRDGRQAHCRACRARIVRLSHARHRQTRRDYQKRFRLRNKILKTAYLRQHPCVDCGESDPQVLEFDHCGEKRDNISSMLAWQTSWRAIEQEIARCKVRCANCHRRKTLRELTMRN